MHVSLVSQSCQIICEPKDCSLPGSSVHGDSPGKNTGVGCHALLQEIFPTQGSNSGLPHCSWILPWATMEAHRKYIIEWYNIIHIIVCKLDYYIYLYIHLLTIKKSIHTHVPTWHLHIGEYNFLIIVFTWLLQVSQLKSE